MRSLIGEWLNLQKLVSKSYICGYCGATTAINTGYLTGDHQNFIYICGGCNRPTFFDFWSGSQTPPPTMGNTVSHLPDDLNNLYEQGRRCVQVNSFTAAVLICRKILMHIAVEKGAVQNLKFIQYVEFLADKGYIPPNGKDWVDIIRKKGNEATHEIVLMSNVDAQDLLSFTEMLLRFVYEFPARLLPLPEE